MNLKKYISEVLGTFILVFCATGASVINQETQGVIGHVGISISVGLLVMVLIYAFGDISGAHFNPAVSIAFVVAKKFSAKELMPYIFSQAIGAIMASLLLKFLFPNNQLLGATMPAGTELQSFILEFILTFILMLVIMNVAHGSKEQGMFAGIAIGATLLMECMFAGPISGASMNPIRSFAPAIVSGHTEHLWIYLTATIMGAVSAIPVWKFLSEKK